MSCPECETRRQALRDAIMHGKMAEALDITVEGLRVMIGIDAGADHRKDASPPSLSGKNKSELLEIGAAEGVEISDGATNAEIISAIEAARAAPVE